MQAAQYLPLLDAIEAVIGRRVSTRTALRWVVAGVRAKDGTRAVLAKKKIGGRLMTTTQNVTDWVNATNAEPQQKRSTRSRKAAVKRFYEVANSL